MGQQALGAPTRATPRSGPELIDAYSRRCSGTTRAGPPSPTRTGCCSPTTPDTVADGRSTTAGPAPAASKLPGSRRVPPVRQPGPQGPDTGGQVATRAGPSSHYDFQAMSTPSPTCSSDRCGNLAPGWTPTARPSTRLAPGPDQHRHRPAGPPHPEGRHRLRIVLSDEVADGLTIRGLTLPHDDLLSTPAARG